MFPLLDRSSNSTHNNLANFINKLELFFIILDDLKAYGSMWHCNSTNAKGRIIEKILGITTYIY